MSVIRPAAVAGAFYPADAGELQSVLRACMAEARVTLGPVPKAIVAPHAGYIYSGAVAASAYSRIKPAHARIKRVVLLGPCHRVAVRGLALSGADAFDTPFGPVAVDKAAEAEIAGLPQVQVFDATHAQEHSLEVHLPFLMAMLDDFKIVPLVVGQATPEEVAEVLERLWGGPETLIVVSSDLSHYQDYDNARAIDTRTCHAIENLAPNAISSQGACGRFPLGGLLTQAKKRGLIVETVDLRNSGDTAGPRDRVVGYGSWLFLEPTRTPAPEPTAPTNGNGNGNGKAETDFGAATRALLARHGDMLLRLAARSIEAGLKSGKPLQMDPKKQVQDLAKAGACFVTLKRDGQLRGCIGSPEVYRPLIVDVVENAFSAAFNDPRFPKVTAAELPGLELSISVLSPQVAMRVRNEADLLSQLRPGIDGLVIEDAGKRALFLPAVWKQLPDPKVFLAQLKQKAGMKPTHWSAAFRARRFVAEEVSSADLRGGPLWSAG